MDAKLSALSLSNNSKTGKKLGLNFKFSLKQSFIAIYEWLSENHPQLLITFVIIGVPLLSIAFLMLVSSIIISPFVILLGW